MSTIQSITDQFNITAQTLAKLNNERSNGSLTDIKIQQILGIQGKRVKEFRQVLSKLVSDDQRNLAVILAQAETSKSHASSQRENIEVNSIDQLEDAIKAGKVQEGDSIVIRSLNTRQGNLSYQIEEETQGTIRVAQVPRSQIDSLYLSICDLNPPPARLASNNLLVNKSSTNIDFIVIPK